MAASRIALRSARAIARLEPCIMCQSHQLALAIRRNATRYPTSSCDFATSMRVQNYATKQRIDAPRLRADVDARGRLGFYTLTKHEGIHKIEPRTAMSIYDDFVAHKNTMPHGKNVLRIVNKYNVPLNDVASLAIVTFKIPDIGDAAKRAQLPPSQHKNTAGLLLQGCAQSGDPLAITHILTAVYLGGSGHSSAQEITRLFPKQEIAQYHLSLDAIDLQSLEKDPGLVLEISTLRGLFLEQAGQKQAAKKAYQQVITTAALKYQPGQSAHAMKLPLIAPWNALGYLLKADKDPKVQAEAKFYFQKGALEGDDPLSYYELAAFEPRTSEKWLQYTSKAAASGHEQAILNLTDFYQEVATVESTILKSDSIRKALNWVLSWRRGSTAALAREWQQVASVIGHKPSMLQLADYYDSIGNNERARRYLHQIIETPSTTNQKEGSSQLLQVARKRLAGFR